MVKSPPTLRYFIGGSKRCFVVSNCILAASGFKLFNGGRPRVGWGDFWETLSTEVLGDLYVIFF
jgi:hypothetical protein